MLEQMEDDGMVQHLRCIEERLRQEYGITSTLREELDAAVAAEDYEPRAQLRDELKRRPVTCGGESPTCRFVLRS